MIDKLSSPNFDLRVDDNSDIETMPFEQARDELNQVVARLESGGEPLEASLALWERGEALAARCQAWLDGARARLAQATGDGATTGGATTGEEPF